MRSFARRAPDCRSAMPSQTFGAHAMSLRMEPVTKLSHLKDATSAGDWPGALPIAARFPDLGEHKAAIKGAHAAARTRTRWLLPPPSPRLTEPQPLLPRVAAVDTSPEDQGRRPIYAPDETEYNLLRRPLYWLLPVLR